jgi:branched-chain amino acid transport system ATP-binding protein
MRIPAATMTSARLVVGPIGALLVVAAMKSGVVPVSEHFTIALAAVYGIVVLSVSLLAGWGGVWSVGHPALLAIGAYTASYGTLHNWGIELTLLVATCLAAASGAFIGYAGARFSILYIALLTLAFDLVALELVGRWVSITGGDEGISVGALPSKLGLHGILTPDDSFAAAVLTFGVVLALAVAVRQSVFRMRLVASKSHPAASRTVAIAPELQTALAFAVSGAATAVAGVLFATMSGFVSPEPFSLALATNIIAAAVLGGIGSVSGAVVGGSFMAWSPSLARTLGVSQPILQGVILIACLIFLRKGVIPSLAQLARRLLAQRKSPIGHAVASGATDTHADEARVDQKSPGVTADSDAVLVVDQLGVRFAGLIALKDVSVSAHRGEILGIIGPNGAGKTTLINVLSGLNAGGRVSGNVTASGDSLLKTRPTRRRGMGIGRTFQHAELFSELTVYENVLCTNRLAGRSRRARVHALLQEVGLSHAANSAPADLSFGLQKRIDLARAISESPEILLMDEPFGGLDGAERAIMREQIRRLNAAGTTIVIVDHVLDELFAVADRVIAFDFGTPIAEGKPQEVLRDERVRAAYLGEGTDSQHAQREHAVVTHGHAADASGDAAPAISLNEVGFHYGGVSALADVSLAVPAGCVVGIVGANGAGKSTLGRVLGGIAKPSSGERRTAGSAPRCSVVPEGRALFRTLSIKENLEVAAYGAGLRGAKGKARVAEMLQWLPERLRSRATVAAGSLSGGEQQMLAIARGLVSSPDVLILDEPALGLAPVLVDEVYARVGDLAASGITVVLLEQLLSRAVAHADEIVILRDGHVVASGTVKDTAFVDRAERAYFGEASTELLADSIG